LQELGCSPGYSFKVLNAVSQNELRPGSIQPGHNLLPFATRKPGPAKELLTNRQLETVNLVEKQDIEVAPFGRGIILPKKNQFMATLLEQVKQNWRVHLTGVGRRQALQGGLEVALPGW